MKHSHRTSVVALLGLGTLLLTGCGKADSGAGATKVASNSTSKVADAQPSAPSDAPAAVAASEQATSKAAPAAAVKEPAQKPGSNPDNARNPPKRSDAGIDKLETDYDLSKVEVQETALKAEADEHDHSQHEHEKAAQTGDELLPANQAERNKGRLSVVDGKQSFDFGKLRQGEAASHVFELVSDGEEPLIITGVKPSCGCTKADVHLVGADGAKLPYTKGDPIPVGTHFGIETDISTDGRQGPFSAQVSIYANDARGAFTVRLAADIEPVLTVEPSPTMFFGKITTADTGEQIVTVATTRGEKFKLTPAQEVMPAPVKVEYTPKFPDADGKSAEWDVKVVLGPNTEIGMRNYPLTFKSDLPISNPKYPSQDGSPQFHSVMINVQAQVTGMVSAEPSFLTFGMVRPGEAVERVLRIESHDDFTIKSDMPVVFEGLQGQEFPYTDVFKVTIEPQEGGKVADLKVSLVGFPPELNGSFGGVLKLKIGHPFMEELQVRFSGVCRPQIPATAPATGGAAGGK